MDRLFGTDGVRGVANADLTPDLALALGRAAAQISDARSFVVGRDTRLSGPMLTGALTAGLCSAGADVLSLGIVPTPAVAYATVRLGCSGGAMVSASHNPVPDNGIKFFSPQGLKLDPETEGQIEEALTERPSDLPTGTGIGQVRAEKGVVEAYLEHLVTSVTGRLDGVKVVLDLAHGAAHELGPRAFRDLGAEVISMHEQPDGTRINVNCGSTELSALRQRVVAEGADLGLAFDGDADRVLACDEAGREIDGDQLIALFALRLQDQGVLKNDLVVATVMANLGFNRAMHDHGIEVMQVPVGDRYVMDGIITSGAALGGEQSGHIIFSDSATTGDGILTGLQLAATVAAEGRPLSALAHVFERVPQVLLNVGVRNKGALDQAEGLWAEVAAAERALGDEGRVLLRSSGTEPVVRVMVEAVDPLAAQEWARKLAAEVERHLA